MTQRPAIELTPDEFLAGDPLGRTDATPFTLKMFDNLGKQYEAKFTVRNCNVGQMSKTLKMLIPVKRVH